MCEAVSFISLGWNCWLKVYSKLMFSTSRNSRAVLHDCTIFHLQQQCMHVQAIVSVPKDIVKQGNTYIAGFRIKAQLSPLFSVLQHYNHNISQAPLNWNSACFSNFIQVVGRIQFLLMLGLSSLATRSHPSP